MLQARVQDGSWNRLQPGDLAQLDGRGSHFGPLLEVDETLVHRCHALDIHPTGPLWGSGDSPSRAAVAVLEAHCASAFPDALRLLETEGLRQERRALRMRVQELEWNWQAATRELVLRFGLGRGSYATTLLDLILGADAARDLACEHTLDDLD